jgi:hypothetical protein
MVDYSKPWLLFWAAVIIAHIYMDSSFVRKWRSWNRGMSSSSAKSEPGHVVKLWLSEVLLQRQLLNLSFFRWFVHLLMFYGFIGLVVLSLFTVILRPLGYLGIDGGMASFSSSANFYKSIGFKIKLEKGVM